MASIIGIDLGTSFSVVASIDPTGRPYIVPNSEGVNLTPSCVVEKQEGVMEVGEYARRQWGNAPETAAARFKRDMGTSVKRSICGKEFTPTQLSTFVLKKLLADTVAKIGPIGDAVVTIPANFAHEAREATLAAAKNAGLDVKFIINEPTAAALYYAFKGDRSITGKWAVYDLGGGTFDISVIQVNAHDVNVLATNGIAKLGGDDFDAAIQTIVRRKFKQQVGKELKAEDFTKNDAEKEKRSLSHRKEVTLRVARQLVDVSRDEFEEEISALITQTEMLCEATLDEARIRVAELNGVILAGGSTRVPIVQESVKRIFGKEPTITENVDEVVALGAALYAAYKSDRKEMTAAQKAAVERIKVSESTSKCFGTISLGYNATRGEHKPTNNILIPKSSPIPCSVTESFYTVREGQEAVNCQVTESTAPETDPRFVKVIWSGELALPAGRPANQEIKVTFAYDANQTMKCAFVDVATGRRTDVDLSMTAASAEEFSAVNKFLVE